MREERVIVTEETTAKEPVHKDTVSPATTATRVIWFIAGVIITLLLLRIVLLLLAANDTAEFVNFIYMTSNLFAAPFYGIFNYQPSYGQSTFEISSVVAVAVYALVAWGISQLLTLTKSRREV